METENTYGSVFFTIAKGVGASLACSFLSVLAFAGLLGAVPMPDKVIYPIGQTIKVISIVVGTLAFVRGEKGWLKGGVIGLLFAALSYLLFSVLGGDFSLSWLIFLELFLSVFAGALGGIIAVNIKK